MSDKAHKAISGRASAAKALDKVNLKKDYAAEVLEQYLNLTDERQRATDIVTGVIRNLCIIDAVIEKCADKPVKRISKRIINIIRVGVYEFVYCPQAAEHAIVNEAVETAKDAVGTKEAGFINAVLRAVQRHIVNRNMPLADAPIRQTVPVHSTGGCQFDFDILPDADKDPAEFLALAFSLPQWLVAGWLKDFGLESCRRACFGSNRRPAVYVRPNTLKVTTSELAEMFAADRVEFKVAETSMLRLANPQAVTELPGFSDGLFTVQDPTAAQAVRLLNPQKGWKILDLCAAPGTKTVQLAETTADEATILATDIDSERLKKVGHNITRLGIKNVKIFPYFLLPKICIAEGPFDCILLDVPCSNTGVLARRPEVRHRLTPQAVKKLTQVQYRLLQSADKILRVGATLCYSTCSIQSVENTEQIKAFLNDHPRYTLESELLTLPSPDEFDHDGGYTAILQKA